MPNVQGRIDHMALDIEHQRIYVAALGNNTLEVLDLRSGKVTQTVSGLKEPQGVVFVPEMGKLFVTTGGDGKCYAYSGDPLLQISVADIGEDADNIRYDGAGKRLYAGYGSGALAVIDPPTLKRLGDIKLAGHPESFQLEKAGPKIYINVPDARQIAVADRGKQNVVSTWPIEKLQANFPMALIEAEHRILVATRKPAKLVIVDSASGRIVAEMDCAGDADDLFYDVSKKFVYVSCGEGVIDVFSERDPDHYQEVVRIPTASGARTSLWVPELNQLFLAAPSRDGRQAAVHIYGRE
jgi:YVTN family beta-propeller protein